MDKKNNKKLWAYTAVGAIIILITLFSIKWISPSKPLGDKTVAHIYAYDSYNLLCAALYRGEPIIALNPDRRFDDEFIFEYDSNAGLYTISKMIYGIRYYICLNEDNTLTLSENCNKSGCLWKIVRQGNTMYYLIFNPENNYALSRIDGLFFNALPLNEDDDRMYFRLE